MFSLVAVKYYILGKTKEVTPYANHDRNAYPNTHLAYLIEPGLTKSRQL